jgi:hypothetical protein
MAKERCLKETSNANMCKIVKKNRGKNKRSLHSLVTHIHTINQKKYLMHPN